MESSDTAASSSSRLSTAKFSHDEPNISQQNLAPETTYELDALSGVQVPLQPEPTTWPSRASRTFAHTNPRAHAWIVRAIRYLRGPRPKVDLPRA